MILWLYKESGTNILEILEAPTVPLTIRTIIFAGSSCKALCRNYWEPTKILVLAVEGRLYRNLGVRALVYGFRGSVGMAVRSKRSAASAVGRRIAKWLQGPDHRVGIIALWHMFGDAGLDHEQ